MFTGYLVLCAMVAIVIGWLVAEFKGSRKTRVTLGLAAIGLIAFFASLGGTVNAYYTALYYRDSLPMIRDLLVQARYDETVRILEAYSDRRRGNVDQLNNARQLSDALGKATAVRSNNDVGAEALEDG